MKLHLPKSLLSALVACVSILGSIATTSTVSSSALLGAVTFTLLSQEVQATDQTYIYTGDTADMATNTALGSVNGEGAWTLFPWTAGSWNAADDNNIIRFVTNDTYEPLAGADLGTVKGLGLASGNINLGGFIVDAEATGYSFTATTSGFARNFVLRGSDSTNADSRALFEINEDFSLSSLGSSAGNGRDVRLEASVDATVAAGKKFTINANLAGGAGETFYLQGGGTLEYNDNANADATATAFDWHLSEASTLKLTGARATGSLTAMLGTGSMSLDSGTLQIDSANATSLTNHIIVGNGGGTIQGTNVSLDGRIAYTTTPTTGGNALTLNGSFTLGAALVIDLGITGDIADGDYTLLKRTDGTVGLAETDMDVLKNSLSIEGIIDPTRLDALAWVNNELVLTIVSSTAASLTYTGGADEASISSFTWDTVNGDFDGNAIFANNDLVTFTGYTEATLEESISAGVVTLEDNAYLSIMGSSTNTFSANRVIVGAGATLELGRDALTTALNVQGEATSNVIIDGSDTGGNLADILNLSTFSGSLTYYNGIMTVAAASDFGAISKLTLGNDAIAKFSGITVDKEINVAGTAIVTSTTGTTTLGNITGDSGSLNLNGAIRLQGDVDYTGVINIVSGTTTFGSGQASTENMAASLIDVRTGAQFNVLHGSGDYTGTDIMLNASRIHSEDLDAGTGVHFGTLTVDGASIISHAYNGIFSFEKLTGDGNIDFQANAGTGEDGQLTIKSVNKYTGTLNVSQGDVEDRLQFFETTFDQTENHEMLVSATSGSEIELVNTTFKSEDGSGKVSFATVVEMWNVNTLESGTLELAGFQFAAASEVAALRLDGGRLNLLGASIDSTADRSITAGDTTIGTTLDATVWADAIELNAVAGESTTIDTEKVGSGSATITLSGVLSGTGALSVNGAGKLILSNSNTNSGGITIRSTSTLEAAQADSLGTGAITNYGLILASNGLTVGSAQNVTNEGVLRLGGTLTINKTIDSRANTASITLAADTVFDLAGAVSDTTTHIGYTTYKLFDITPGGGLDASAMGLTDGLLTFDTNVLLEGATLVENYTWVLRDDGTITYGPRGVLSWDGPSGIGGEGTGGSGVWGADNVWDNSFGSDATFQNGDIVIFDKGAGTVTVAADVAAATITITDTDSTDANSVAYTFTDSAIKGVATLIVSETASATFNNSIDLSAAAVTVTAGSSLSLGTTTEIDSLSNSGSVSTTDSADLTIKQAVGGAGGTLDVAGNLILGGTDKRETNVFTTLTVAGDVTNNATLFIGDTSNITGTLSGGAIDASGNTSVGGLGSALSAFKNSAGTFDVNSDMVVTGNFDNAGTVDVAGALTLNTAEGTIIAGNAVTLNSTTASTVTALTMAADQNLSLNAKLTVTGTLTGTGHLTVTTLATLTSGLGVKEALLSAGSLSGVTSLQLALSDGYLLALALDDAQTMTLVELGAASGLTLDDLTFADGASDSYTAGTTQFSFGFDGNNITLTATIVGNRWQSDDANAQWGSNDSWSGAVPTSAENAIFDGAGSHLVAVDQVGASASEIRVAVKAGSDREMDGYAFSGETLTTGNLTLSSGLVEVGNTINIVDDNPETVAQKGALNITGGKLTIANNGAINAVLATVSTSNSLEIESGGSLTITGTLMATDATGITVTNDGQLQVGDGSQIDIVAGAGLLITQAGASVAVTSLGEQSLDLSEGSTLSVATDSVLKGMTGTGTLEFIDNGAVPTSRKLTVDASAVITGGDVSAAMLEVSTGANTLFNNLTVDSIHFANDLSSSDFYLGARSISHSMGTSSVAVTMASANFFENAANGSYKFFQQNGGTVTWSNFALSQSILDDIASAITQDQGNFTYRDVLQTRDENGNLTFIVQDTTGRTWDMDNDFAVTPTTDPNIDDSLSQIKPIYDPANAGKIASYDVLDYVNKVIIGESKQTIDMTNLSGTGELILSNLSGDSASAELNIIGNGTDSVLLRNTTLSVVSGDINAKDVTLNVQNVGEDNQLYTGTLNLDESTLDTGVTGRITVQGLTNLNDAGEASTGSVVQGSISVNGAGGDYTGSYGTGASIYAQAGADQKLKADAALTVGGAGGTLTITGATSAAQLGGINSTGAHIVIDLTSATSESNALTLGSASSVTDGGSLTLSINGDFLEAGDTVVAFAGEALTIDSNSTLTINAINFDQSPAVSSGGLIQLIEFADGSSIADESITLDAALSKYYTNVRYDSTLNMIVANINTSFYNSHAITYNGTAGFELITDALTNIGISSSSSNSDLAKVMAEMDKLITTNPLSADKLAAATAGASIATQGMALQDDMERQLRSIRNHAGNQMASEMNYGQTDVVNGWINAEGNQAELSGEGTDAGYTMSNWGGTVGAGFSLDANSTLGIALTAMYGDLTSSDVDQLDSDVSTYYLSVFAHTEINDWDHKFILSAGMADFSGSRTVNFANSAYSTDYSTSGYALGMHYELARNYYLNDDKSTLWQPLASVSYQMSQIDGYTESGSDAALHVDSQSIHRATLALGARMQTNIGESMFNRTGNFSLRALLKGDIGDNRSDTEVGLALGTDKAKIQSAERGNFGVEVGAGLNIPIFEGTSSIFCDAAVELRENYSNVNATVGYRFNF